MRTALTTLCCLLALPALAQRPPGSGVLSGFFFTGVTPEDRQIAKPTRFFYELLVGGKTWRYPALVNIDCPGHSFRYICKARGLPTNVVLTNIRIVVVEPGNKTSFCTPTNFDGRAALLSSSRASVMVDGKKLTATKPGRMPDSEKPVTCPVGMGSLSGLKFAWSER
ncbi:MAG: hypothetical protein QM758_16595 [Armatimonas sp.]